MKEKNKNKEIYVSIPELSVCKTRESQPYKKEIGTPDKDTQGWITAETSARNLPGRVVAETPESCGRQLLGWSMANTRWVTAKTPDRNPSGWLGSGTWARNNAFTLIELLVVVLIIGILAAIAVPQYQKSVWKARYTQAKSIAKSIADAEELYYMANGKYTHYFNELGVDIPGLTSKPWCNENYCEGDYIRGTLQLVANQDRAFITVILYNSGSPFIAYHKGFVHSSLYTNQSRCIVFGEEVPTSHDLNWKVCQHETNKGTPSGWGANSMSWIYH